MTKYEQFMFNKRRDEFYEKVYNGEPIGIISRQDYLATKLILKGNSFYLDNRHLIDSSMPYKDVDYLAFLYASSNTKEFYDYILNVLEHTNYLQDTSLTFTISDSLDFYFYHSYSEDTKLIFNKVVETYKETHQLDDKVNDVNDDYEFDLE